MVNNQDIKVIDKQKKAAVIDIEILSDNNMKKKKEQSRDPPTCYK